MQKTDCSRYRSHVRDVFALVHLAPTVTNLDILIMNSPMNLVTGLWGMNVHVPGQDIESGYAWFGGILGCLALFAVVGAWCTLKIFGRN